MIQKSPGRILSCINLEYIFSIYRFANLLKVGIYLNEKQRSIMVSVDFKLCLEYNYFILKKHLKLLSLKGVRKLEKYIFSR